MNPNPAIAEEGLGVATTFSARSGWWRWRSSGRVAQAQKQSDVTTARRATGRSSLRPKTWYSAETTNAPATIPVT